MCCLAGGTQIGPFLGHAFRAAGNPVDPPCPRLSKGNLQTICRVRNTLLLCLQLIHYYEGIVSTNGPDPRSGHLRKHHVLASTGSWYWNRNRWMGLINVRDALLWAIRCLELLLRLSIESKPTSSTLRSAFESCCHRGWQTRPHCAAYFKFSSGSLGIKLRARWLSSSLFFRCPNKELVQWALVWRVRDYLE